VCRQGGFTCRLHTSVVKQLYGPRHKSPQVLGGTPFGTACRINGYLALGGMNYPEVRRGYRRMQKWKMGEPMAYKVSQH
jgi:hypothetical protein